MFKGRTIVQFLSRSHIYTLKTNALELNLHHLILETDLCLCFKIPVPQCVATVGNFNWIVTSLQVNTLKDTLKIIRAISYVTHPDTFIPVLPQYCHINAHSPFS